MSDLVVNADLLMESITSLHTIKYEFEHTSEHQHDLADDWGSGDIEHAMNSFAGNWNYHRKQLLSSIEAVGEMAEKSYEAFGDVDTKLEKGLTSGGRN